MKPISLVQLVTVESPCHLAERGGGDWGRHERERFCPHCNLQVHNLSARTIAEADALIAASAGGRLCVRYHHNAAGRPLTIEHVPRTTRLRRFSAPLARSAARIAAFIGLATLSAALGGLTGCSAGGSFLGGKRAEPNAKTAPAVGDSAVVPPNNLTPVGTIGGSLGLTALTEEDFADAVRQQQRAKPHNHGSSDE